MRKSLVRKGLVVGIIVLFFGASILPVAVQSINNNTLPNNGRSTSLSSFFFDSLIEFCMKLGRIYSLSTCVIKNNEIVWSKGYGIYDKEQQKQGSADTIYLIASISKTITATAILQQVDNARIDLDEDVNGYLDFDFRNPYFPDVPITYRMLLNHTSSLNIEPASFYQVEYGKDSSPISSWLKDYFYDEGVMNKSKWRNCRPGKEFGYSNLGFTILGYLVEKITNQSFNQYCKEKIFMPLDMTNTSFLLSEINMEKHAVPYILAYVKSGDFPTLYLPLPHYSICFYPAGGLRTSVLDLSHFVIAHMNRGVYNGVRILNESTVEEMHNISVHWEGNWYFGLGWGICQNSQGKRLLEGHSGSLYGYITQMQIKPEDSTAIIYFSTKDLAGGYIKENIEQYPYRLLKFLLFQKAKYINN
jgi:CubicO group peptidase (beta-lactamase class C family)